MTTENASLLKQLLELHRDATAYFGDAEAAIGTERVYDYDPAAYWNKLPEELWDRATSLSARLIELAAPLAEAVSRTPILTGTDQEQIGHSLKAMRAALRLRRYRHWEADILHDEGQVLGVQRAGQSESQPLSPREALLEFDQAVDALDAIVELTVASAPGGAAISMGFRPTPASSYRPETAFIMMWMDRDKPELLDLGDTVKRCFKAFEIEARRADDIEHEDVITARIIDEIRTAEFLFADLTGERPSVYYEVGYAHALGRRVMRKCSPRPVWSRLNGAATMPTIADGGGAHDDDGGPAGGGAAAGAAGGSGRPLSRGAHPAAVAG